VQWSHSRATAASLWEREVHEHIGDFSSSMPSVSDIMKQRQQDGMLAQLLLSVKENVTLRQPLDEMRRIGVGRMSGALYIDYSIYERMSFTALCEVAEYRPLHAQPMLS
jgi:hypothetical protein